MYGSTTLTGVAVLVFGAVIVALIAAPPIAFLLPIVAGIGFIVVGALAAGQAAASGSVSEENRGVWGEKRPPEPDGGEQPPS